jgi:HPt (histidine-containing phosphotransfer) domain-containing protein
MTTMDGRRSQDPGPRERSLNDAADANGVRDSAMAVGITAPSPMSTRLASELFARLLLELPAHRRELHSALRTGDQERLARAAHKLLGAVVYCNLPELAEALRELKRMTESGDATRTGPALDKVLRQIDELLACSGYRET